MKERKLDFQKYDNPALVEDAMVHYLQSCERDMKR